MASLSKCVWSIGVAGLMGMWANGGMVLAGGVVDTNGASVTPPTLAMFVERPGQAEFSGQLIVKPKRGLDAETDAAARARVAGALKYYADVDEYVVLAAAGGDAANGQVRGAAENAAAAELMATGWYEYVTPNWILHTAGVPDDPWFSQQWHHVMMGAVLGWDMTTGDARQIIAVTDTGIDVNHPDLAPHRVPGFNAFTDLPETSGGNVVDDNGHGTHVAGCVAAIGNNGQGVAGVNWNARIMMVKVTFGGGSAYADDILQGARWAVDHGAKIVSTSFTGVEWAAVETTGQYIRSRGGLFFHAAGNDGRNLSWFDWPNVIVVGASSRTDGRVGLSAYGRAVDVFAPGEAIVSTVMGGGYQAWTGTSMAAPVAAGVASLIWAANPDLTANEVQSILFTTCRDIGTIGEDDTFGMGRIDALAGVLEAVRRRVPACLVDFNGDSFVDFFDYDAFVDCYEAGQCPDGKTGDFNGDGFIDFFDYDEFVVTFEGGC